MSFESAYTAPTHHVYLIFGTMPEELKTDATTDTYSIRFGRQLRVEDVRWLHEYAHQSVDTPMRRVVIETAGMTTQAQNALLKLFEELQQGVYFFLFLPSGSSVLATLRSRCFIIDAGDDQHTLSETFESFIAASPRDRLKTIDTLWEQGEQIRHTAVLDLLHDLERYLHRMHHAGEHTSTLIRTRKVADSLRDALHHGALHKGTLQLAAFI